MEDTTENAVLVQIDTPKRFLVSDDYLWELVGGFRTKRPVEVVRKAQVIAKVFDRVIKVAVDRDGFYYIYKQVGPIDSEKEQTDVQQHSQEPADVAGPDTDSVLSGEPDKVEATA